MGLGWLNDTVIGDTASISPPCCLCHQLSPETGSPCSHETGQDFCPAVERIPPSAVECESSHYVWDGPGTPCVRSTAFLLAPLSTMQSALQGLAHALAPPWPPGLLCLPPACTVSSLPAVIDTDCWLPASALWSRTARYTLSFTLLFVIVSPTHLYWQIKNCVSHFIVAQNVGVEQALKSPVALGDNSEK